MERFDYQIQTSITPSYSLLNHGVGDSEAFAKVYAAMCRSAGLECQTVLGTVDGEVRYWNIIRYDERYAHVDLLYSSRQGAIRELSDAQMKNLMKWKKTAKVGNRLSLSSGGAKNSLAPVSR